MSRLKHVMVVNDVFCVVHKVLAIILFEVVCDFVI